MYKVAVIGFGGLGKVHFKNLLQIEKERNDICICAICGADKANIQKTSKINLGETDLKDVDFSRFHFYDTIDELLENEEMDFAISALPTFMHAEVAIKLMAKGISVFSEKPMALNIGDCKRMLDASVENNVNLMIGQALRFDGVFKKLKEIVDSNIYGKLLRAEFTRYSQLPKWTFNNWILDLKQSGGCALDMHCHDVDIINYFFGMPESVSSYATSNKVELEAIFTRYMYPDKIVTAKADWSFTQTYPFCAHTIFMFEQAVAEIKDNVFKIYTDNEVIVPEYESEDMFLYEIREFIDCAVNKKESKISTAKSVMNSMKIIMAELESAKKCEIVEVTR